MVIHKGCKDSWRFSYDNDGHLVSELNNDDDDDDGLASVHPLTATCIAKHSPHVPGWRASSEESVEV